MRLPCTQGRPTVAHYRRPGSADELPPETAAPAHAMWAGAPVGFAPLAGKAFTAMVRAHGREAAARTAAVNGKDATGGGAVMYLTPTGALAVAMWTARRFGGVNVAWGEGSALPAGLVRC